MHPFFLKRVLASALFLVLLSCSKKDGGGGQASLPEVSIGNVTGERSTTETSLQFDVSLNTGAAGEVRMHYATAPFTAKEGTDYISTSGTLTIPAGQTRGTIVVKVTGDSLRRASQLFSVKLDQPQNCTLKRAEGVGTIVNENGPYLPTENSGYTTPAVYAGYNLVWADEFNGREINTAIWNHELGGNGWGNNELEAYTDRPQNSFVSDGHLVIEARAEAYGASQYTSARMVTKGRKAFKFGRVDIRAKLPKTKGIWPALWMLGNNIDQVSWPACGEIDIMELLGQEPSKIYQTLHYGSTASTHQSYGTNYTLAGEGFDEKFHVFSLVWEQDSLKMYVDDKLSFSANSSRVGDPYPFNSEFFFIFNIAVGGNWPGSPTADTQLPQRMFVDYIRVFQK